MLRVAAAALDFFAVSRPAAALPPRRGVTLVELLVAMVVAGIVATFVFNWIAHTARQAGRAQQRDDREEELALLRNELFQDGGRCRTLELARDRWKLIRPRSNARPDTIEWRFAPDRLLRNQRQKLSNDTLLEGAIEPHFAGMDPNWDAWTQADRNFDGLVDPEILSRLDRLTMRIVVRRRIAQGQPAVVDTLLLWAPLLGPG